MTIDLNARKHGAQITFPNGSTQRWGPDEPDVRRVIQGLSTSTELPGGFGPGSLTLGRPSSFDPLIPPLSFVRTYVAETNQTIHEGRIVGTPQSGSESIDVELEGMSKHLEDDNTAAVIFYDRDFNNWQGPSVARQVALITALQGFSEPTVEWDTVGIAPSLKLELIGAWNQANTLCESWYDAKGLTIGFVDYAWKKSSSIDNADTSWVWYVRASTDDQNTSIDDSGSLRAAGPSSGTLTTTATNKKFAVIQLVYSVAGGSAQVNYDLFFTFLGVVGTHGLPLQGTLAAPNTGRGLLVSDMLGYAIGRWAPLLSYSTGIGGSIEATAFAVPHSTFIERTNTNEIVQSLVAFGGNANYPLDWGVYDKPGTRGEFFAKTPGTYGRTWRMRRDQAVEDPSDGPDVSTLINGVLVNYDDGTGTTLSVGPTGSGAQTESALLLDTSPSNYANNDGARHWAVYDAGITSAAGALLIGQLVLADANRKPWRGTITVKGSAVEQGGMAQPCGLVRAGDQCVVEDDPDTRVRQIVNTSYDGTNLSASVGQPPDQLSVLLARAGVVLTGRL